MTDSNTKAISEIRDAVQDIRNAFHGYTDTSNRKVEGIRSLLQDIRDLLRDCGGDEDDGGGSSG